jgi:predicted Zn-dependent protease
MSDDRLLMTRRQCCLGLMALLAAGCSTGESRPSLISENKERELGQEAASEVERTIGLVQDPALVGCVREIGRRLVAQTP